jgi:AbrB family looped-hinge helix DNA binding protein
MSTTAVTSKGQVTIPLEVRRQLGIRQGSRLEFRVVNGHVEMRMAHQPPAEVGGEGFGMLKSRRKPVPADFDPAHLLSAKRK